MLESMGAVIQARHPGSEDYGKATIKLLKELNRPLHYGGSHGGDLSLGSQIVLQAALSDYHEISSTEIAPMKSQPCRACPAAQPLNFPFQV